MSNCTLRIEETGSKKVVDLMCCCVSSTCCYVRNLNSRARARSLLQMHCIAEICPMSRVAAMARVGGRRCAPARLRIWCQLQHSPATWFFTAQQEQPNLYNSVLMITALSLLGLFGTSSMWVCFKILHTCSRICFLPLELRSQTRV